MGDGGGKNKFNNIHPKTTFLIGWLQEMTSEAYIGIFVFSLVFPYTICHTAKRKDIPLYAQGFFATSHNLRPPELPF